MPQIKTEITNYGEKLAERIARISIPLNAWVSDMNATLTERAA